MDSGPAVKRPRYDNGPHMASPPQYAATGNGNNYSRPPLSQQQYEERDRNAPPSLVVHVRNLPEMAVEADVYEAASRFGQVKCIVMLPKTRQSLVEFTELDSATRCAQARSMPVRGADTEVNFSTSQHIHRAGATDEMPKEHNVLLLSVNNAQYPIDVDVIHKICAPHGNVLRIVVFRKLGIQAMVEFDTVQAAATAKSFLNGADIYSGCCTLKIEYAKPTTLSILRNDKESWDYTNPNLPGPSQQQQQPPPDANGRPAPLLQAPQGGYGGGYPPSGQYSTGSQDHRQGYPDQSGQYDQRPPYDSRQAAPAGGYGGYDSRPRDQQYDSYGRQPEPYGRGGGDQYSQRGYDSGPHGGGGDYGSSGSVAMLYGLAPQFNCDRVFNLFCLYGNVLRIKFLKSKEGSAMIQMSDAGAMNRAIEQLNQIFIFGQKFSLASSRQGTLNMVPNPYPLPDGTPSFKDYTGSRNNRFSTPELAAKNRITPPTRCLHFFNAPAGSEMEEIEEVFTRNGSEKPNITLLGKSERSVSGFAEFPSMEGAVEALIFANHTELPNKKPGHPYLFKVCFTQPGRPNTGPRPGPGQGQAQ